MMIFSTTETLIFNIGINLFSCIITLIIYYNYRVNFSDTYDNQLLGTMELSVLLVLVTDIVMWELNGKGGAFLRALSYLNSILYFIAQMFVAVLWVQYAWYRIFGKGMSKRGQLFGLYLPFVLVSVIICTAPLNGWCFTIDTENYYHRGILTVPISTAALAYIIGISVIALLRYRKETLFDRKTELQTIACFAIPPFFCGMAQLILYGLSLVWTSTVISCLLVLCNRQIRVILQDALTGLNNRRNMERYLTLHKENNASHTLMMIMLDINDFKRINDQYGHDSGDVALVQTANILRTTCNGQSAFLARYGGDEFVILMPEGKAEVAEKTVRTIKDNYDVFNKENHFPFDLSFSIGYAISHQTTDDAIATLLKEADRNMYLDKEAYHKI